MWTDPATVALARHEGAHCAAAHFLGMVVRWTSINCLDLEDGTAGRTRIVFRSDDPRPDVDRAGARALERLCAVLFAPGGVLHTSDADWEAARWYCDTWGPGLSAMIDRATEMIRSEAFRAAVNALEWEYLTRREILGPRVHELIEAELAKIDNAAALRAVMLERAERELALSRKSDADLRAEVEALPE